MSTVPEVIVAAHAGMAVLGLSLITNQCVAPGDTTTPPSHEEVLAATDLRATQMQALVGRIVGLMDTAAHPVPKAAAHFAAAGGAAQAGPARASSGGVGAAVAGLFAAPTDLASTARYVAVLATVAAAVFAAGGALKRA
jgi:hypothetical protein